MKNDFEFLVGTWTSTHRKLTKYLEGSEDWEEFAGISRCWSIFDGAGYMDEIYFPGNELSGGTLRLYDASQDLWSLYWINSKTGLGLPPQVGRFEDTGRGHFLADDMVNGQPVKVNFEWSEITPTSCRWTQLLSADEGRTWETTWVTDFSRTE
ncbi:hypothetical protein [Streptomyces sp. RKAG293]|uniref:hypothetical protein n=1 Tax=Streptomyces sp. RKAG293 TaxID=2893403 RepID=UPI0020334616|nr:hypothetical protein [Streptomyces sp. RKAG293]MCM2416585.1 hypothetical protein [Streptomyces sp. RKAG293]